MTVPFPPRASTRGVAAGIALLFGVCAIVPASLADPFPGGGYNERDQVTNYRCVTPACDVLRHPTANCICIKENPGETKLSRLKLNCVTKQHGEWVACPVQQRYGN
jgi:hypothetical protein